MMTPYPDPIPILELGGGMSALVGMVSVCGQVVFIIPSFSFKESRQVFVSNPWEGTISDWTSSDAPSFHEF